VHDARLVAAMHVHGVTHLLTLNVRDFARYPGITVVHPQTLLDGSELAACVTGFFLWGCAGRTTGFTVH
jgi:hypothetical protein